MDTAITCRHCGAVGDHWSSKCPKRPLTDAPGGSSSPTLEKQAAGGAYVVPGKRGMEKGESMPRRGTNIYLLLSNSTDDNTVRVTNLSEEARDADLLDLFRPFGMVTRVFIAKHKESNKSKGFAFVTFASREEGQRAIDKINGHGYDHLILSLEWARLYSFLFFT